MPLEAARVAIVDRGYLLGDGVFETMRAQDGLLLWEARHAARLRQGVEHLGLASSVAAQAMTAARDLVARVRTRLGSPFHVRLQVTTGVGERLEGAPDGSAITALARPWPGRPPAADDAGLRLVVSAVRKRRDDPLAGVKTLSFLPHVHARREGAARGAHDALLLNDAGRVCEATTSNVLAVVGPRLHAPGPPEGAVDGVTRGLLLEAAAELGLRVEGTLPLDRLARADEVLLTNTVAGVMPVGEIVGHTPALPGPRGATYRRLADAYAAQVRAGRIQARTGTPALSPSPPTWRA